MGPKHPNKKIGKERQNTGNNLNYFMFISHPFFVVVVWQKPLINDDQAIITLHAHVHTIYEQMFGNKENKCSFIQFNLLSSIFFYIN